MAEVKPSALIEAIHDRLPYFSHTRFQGNVSNETIGFIVDDILVSSKIFTVGDYRLNLTVIFSTASCWMGWYYTVYGAGAQYLHMLLLLFHVLCLLQQT